MRPENSFRERNSPVYREIVDTAEAVIAGRIDLVGGCRRLRALSLRLPAPQREPFLPILGFESETDHYPLGDVRDLYAKDYLDRLDREIAAYSQKSRPEVVAACEAIIARFGPKRS
jgi:hypothetical protein